MKCGLLLVLVFVLHLYNIKAVAARHICSETYGTKIDWADCTHAMEDFLERNAHTAQKFLMVPQVAIYRTCKITFRANGDPASRSGSLSSLSWVKAAAKDLFMDCVLRRSGLGGSNNIGALRITAERAKESETYRQADSELRANSNPVFFWFHKGLDSEFSSTRDIATPLGPYGNPIGRPPLPLPPPAKRPRLNSPPLRPTARAPLPKTPFLIPPPIKPQAQGPLMILPLLYPPLLRPPVQGAPPNLPQLYRPVARRPAMGLFQSPQNTPQSLMQPQLPALPPPNNLVPAAVSASTGESLPRSRSPARSAPLVFGGILPALGTFRIPALQAGPSIPNPASRPPVPGPGPRHQSATGPMLPIAPLAIPPLTVTEPQPLEPASMSPPGSQPGSPQGSP